MKSTCIKSEFVQKIFLSIFLKLQVTTISRFTRNTKNNCFAKCILIATSVFHILQCFSNTNTNNALIYLTYFESMFC